MKSKFQLDLRVNKKVIEACIKKRALKVSYAILFGNMKTLKFECFFDNNNI